MPPSSTWAEEGCEGARNDRQQSKGHGGAKNKQLPQNGCISFLCDDTRQ